MVALGRGGVAYDRGTIVAFGIGVWDLGLRVEGLRLRFSLDGVGTHDQATLHEKQVPSSSTVPVYSVSPNW